MGAAFFSRGGGDSSKIVVSKKVFRVGDNFCPSRGGLEARGGQVKEKPTFYKNSSGIAVQTRVGSAGNKNFHDSRSAAEENF